MHFGIGFINGTKILGAYDFQISWGVKLQINDSLEMCQDLRVFRIAEDEFFQFLNKSSILFLKNFG